MRTILKTVHQHMVIIVLLVMLFPALNARMGISLMKIATRAANHQFKTILAAHNI